MGIHDGHRERLKNKFLRTFGEGLEDHELIELLLFYGIPRVNTNEIAHRLFNRFGTIRGVLDAGIDDLCSVDGVGLNSSVLIKVVASLAGRYYLQSCDKRKAFVTFSQIAEYLKALYIGASKEIIYLLLFNNSMKLIADERIGEGNVNGVILQIGKIVRRAIEENASYVIIAHNHPESLPIASNADIEATNRLKQSLDNVNIKLIDHFIVGSGRCNPILHNKEKDPAVAIEKKISDELKNTEIKLENCQDLVFEI